jgi:hypothetical protein
MGHPFLLPFINEIMTKSYASNRSGPHLTVLQGFHYVQGETICLGIAPRVIANGENRDTWYALLLAGTLPPARPEVIRWEIHTESPML